MDVSDVLTGLRGQAGTVDAQLMSDGLFSRILAEESTVAEFKRHVASLHPMSDGIRTFTVASPGSR